MKFFGLRGGGAGGAGGAGGGGEGGEAAGGAVGSFRAFQCCQLFPQGIDRWIEVAAIEVTASLVRAFFTTKNFQHGVRMHHCESSTGFHRHVYTAVFAKFVTGIGQGFYRVTICHLIIAGGAS